MDENTHTAAEQLDGVRAGDSAGLKIARAGHANERWYGIAIGVLIAAMLAVVVYVYPSRQPWLVVPSTVLYGVGIGVAAAIYRQRRNGTSRMTGRRYRVAFLITMVLYGVGVVLSLPALGLSVWFWLSYLVATALPLAIASILRAP